MFSGGGAASAMAYDIIVRKSVTMSSKWRSFMTDTVVWRG